MKYFVDPNNYNFLYVIKIIAWKTPIVFNGKGNAQRGSRTHDPEIKSLMLYRLS